ncbi:MAG: acyl carrier protein [Polyangiaceae bacterium]|nr:acyl carrier protein [Polyangiaceae bacterium]
MNESEVRRRVRQFIESTFLGEMDPSELQDDSSLEQLHLVDSMRSMDLILFVEETFGVTVENDEALPENFDSVSNVVGFVTRKRAGG